MNDFGSLRYPTYKHCPSRLTIRTAAVQCSDLCIAVSLLFLVVSHTGMLFLDRFARVPLASPSELLDHVLGEHATATKLCSCMHQFQKSVLSILADDGYIPHVNHQNAALDHLVDGLPCGPQLRNP